MNKRKIVVFGLDGATWKIIDPLLKNGELPNLHKLCEAGSSGILRSFEPIFSPIIWTSISSGKSPQKHGVSAARLNSNMVKCKRIWDILEENGYSIALCGHLITWPPRKINGYIIPDDLFSQGVETYPNELSFIRKLASGVKSKRLRPGDYLYFLLKCLKFGIKPKNLFKGFIFTVESKIKHYSYLDSYYRFRFIRESFRNDLFIALHNRYSFDYSFYYNSLIDNCCHLYWKYMEPERFANVFQDEVRKYQNIIHDAYIKADRFLGRLLNNIDKDSIVAIVSDHGFCAAEVTEEGWDYIVRTEGLLKQLGIDDQVTGYNLGSASILRLKDQYKGEEERILQLLRSITIKDDGSKLFDVSIDMESNIHVVLRKRPESMKGLTIDINRSYCLFNDIIEENDARISGVHDLEGIFILSGKGISKGKKIDSATVMDITPTLLALVGLPIARDMDGNVIRKAIEPDYLKENPIEYIDTYESEEKAKETSEDSELSEEVKKRLRALGYLG